MKSYEFYFLRNLTKTQIRYILCSSKIVRSQRAPFLRRFLLFFWGEFMHWFVSVMTLIHPDNYVLISLFYCCRQLLEKCWTLSDLAQHLQFHNEDSIYSTCQFLQLTAPSCHFRLPGFIYWIVVKNWAFWYIDN